MGEGEWVVGTVIGHLYREADWPEDRQAPYQVRLDGPHDDDDDDAKIFVPVDRDECVRTTLRFPIESTVECFLGEGWTTGTVVAHYHREPSWEPEQWAPYQIRIDDGRGGTALIFAPVDEDTCVRASWTNTAS